MTDLVIRSESRPRTTEWTTNWMEVDPWLDGWAGFPFGGLSAIWSAPLLAGPRAAPIASDVVDRGDRFEIRAELPGVPKEKIAVHVTGDVLSIGVEEAATRDVSEESFVLRERQERSAQRSFRLSEPTPASAITATFADGVLTVSVPKPKAPAVEKVTVA